MPSSSSAQLYPTPSIGTAATSAILKACSGIERCDMTQRYLRIILALLALAAVFGAACGGTEPTTGAETGLTPATGNTPPASPRLWPVPRLPWGTRRLPLQQRRPDQLRPR